LVFLEKIIDENTDPTYNYNWFLVFLVIDMLTRRRREALKALKKITEERGPISYEELAQELGISKWSAYELLIQLENEGYVQSELRKCNGKCGGRPSLRFSLSPQGEEVLKGESGLESLREEISHYFQLAKRDLRAASAALKEKLTVRATPLLQSARGLTMLLLELRNYSSELYSRIRRIIKSGEDLSLISGAAMVGDREGRLSRIVQICQQALSRLSKAQKELIASILKEEAKILDIGKEA
jgi:predicted transcriptional regulator